MFRFVNMLSFTLVLLSSNLLAQITVGPFTFYPNPASGVFLGIATIDGESAVAGDIIAAFDETGVCAGAAELTIFGSDAYINFPIYGNDSTTDEDDGMDPGEDFYLQLYDASEEEINTYPGSFSEWTNQNGGPMPAYNNYTQIYDFPTSAGGNPYFAVSLDVGVTDLTYSLTVGFALNATDSFDEEFDTYAPPAPPPPAFDAALGWMGDRYYTQIVNGSADDLVEHVWEIQLAYPVENLITLTWDNTGWDILGSFQLTDAFDGLLGIDVDMTEDNSLTLDNSALNTLKLKVTPNGESEAMAHFSAVANYLEVTFTDLSIAGNADITDWSWDFGDENTSTDQNPVHPYTEAGTYPVNLTVTDGNGLSDSYTADVTVAAAVGPTAGFVYDMANITVTFVDISTAGSEAIVGWSWEFGDGGVSSDQDPVHEYASLGEYTVSLTVTDAIGLADTHAEEITVGGNTIGPFTYYPNPSAGVLYGQVTIDGADPAAGSVIAAFDEDGNCAGADYVNVPGRDVYISLTIYGNDPTTDDFDEGMDPGENFYLKLWDASADVIYFYPGGFSGWYNNNGAPMEGYNDIDPFTVYDFPSAVFPTADFSADPTTGDAPLSVQFTDLSESNVDWDITEWSWSFGDGFSGEQNPSHTYNNAGVYTVSLTVGLWNAAGDEMFYNTLTMENYILVGTGENDLPIANNFELALYEDITTEIPFADNSWDADGNVMTYSIVQAASHGMINMIEGNTVGYYVPDANYYGSDEFTYTANDGTGDSEVATVSVIIGAVNDPPVADAGDDDEVNEDEEYQLNGFGSYDSDGAGVTLTYEWTVPDGITLSDPNVGNPTFTAPMVIGDTPFQFTLTVTDDTNLLGEDDVTITVLDIPLTAAFTWSADELTVTFTDASTPAHDEIVDWDWDFGDGEPSTEQNPVHAFLGPGTYTVRLTVTDDSGSQDLAEESIFVTAPGTPNFAVSLAVDGGTGIPYPLTVGFSPNATDGYDEEFDAYAPPAPPPPAFDAALSWEGDRYYTQVVNGSADDLFEHVWTVELAYPSNNLITLTWDNTGWAILGAFQLTDAFDGVLGIDIDMTVDSSLTLDNPAFNTLKLKVTPSGASETMANFTWAADYLDVTFTDMSIAGFMDGAIVPITGWSWDFDGDDVVDSTGVGPHTYAYEAAGTYSPSLTVTDANGWSDSYTEEIMVSLPVPPTADFDYGINGLDVNFVDASTAGSEDITGWSWDFGDGGTASVPNPVHTYLELGTYTVSLTVTDAIEQADAQVEDITITIGGNTVGPFTFYPNPASGSFLGIVTIDGVAAEGQGLDVIAAFDEDGNCAGAGVFTMWEGDAYIYGLAIYGDDPTTPDFDDGMGPGDQYFYLELWDDSEESIYSYPEAFSGWSNQNGAPMPGYEDYTVVYDFSSQVPPMADFTADPTSGDQDGFIPLTVNFSDDSDGAITDWSWNFDVVGGIGFSGDQNPSYNYNAGLYTVSLTVTDENGLADSEIKEHYILVGTENNDAPIVVDFDLATMEDVSVLIPFNSYGYDADGNELTYDVVEEPANGFVHPTGFYVPNLHFFGMDAFTYRAFDGSEYSELATVTIVVAPVPDAPVAIAGIDGLTDVFAEGETVTLNAFASYDPDGYPEALGYFWTAPAEIDLSDPTSGNPTFTAPDVDGVTEFTISLVVSDGQSSSAPATVSITVYNTLALRGIWNQYMIEGGTLEIELVATDIYGNLYLDPVTFEARPDTEAVAWEIDGTVLTLTPEQDWVGSANITVTVTDTITVLGDEITLIDSETFMLLVVEDELGVDDIVVLPEVFALRQNYPNPFNPVTTIEYDVPEIAKVRIDLYNILGQRVRTLVNGAHQPGVYRIRWNGTSDVGNPLSSGMYFYRISSEEFISVKKLVLMK